jgi:GT2 family glycosyltransferase
MSLAGRPVNADYSGTAVISVVVLTHNRVHLLERCVEDVLLRTSPKTKEIIIWNNASEDGTAAYLGTLDDPRIRVVTHESNIGTNAYAHAVALTSEPYIVEVDDDVIEAPPNWDSTLLEAFQRIPDIGYLVADLREDPNDSAYQYLKHVKEKGNVLVPKEVAGFRILEGPTGSGVAMTSRTVYENVGGFRSHKKLVFWHEAAAYVADVRKFGYRTAFLLDLEVWHAGSPYYSEPSRAKLAFHDHRERAEARKNLVKRALLAVPLMAFLNERQRWFDPPEQYEPPDLDPPDSPAREAPEESSDGASVPATARVATRLRSEWLGLVRTLTLLRWPRQEGGRADPGVVVPPKHEDDRPSEGSRARS